MGLFRNLAGQLRVRLTSADPGGALQRISAAGIDIRDLEAENEIRYSFTIDRKNYQSLAAISKRRGDLVHIMERKGVFWDLTGLRRRAVFVLGMVFLLVMAIFLPSRVLMVEVQGNEAIPSNRIIEAAGECGISFGASRRAVRSEKVKNALLEAMPELAWAGVNTYGCRAVISVREREQEPEAGEMAAVSHLVAARDGYILSCDALRGSALCAPGQAVQAGDILISGFTDCGICITATRAEGEVMALTAHSLTAVTPSEWMKKGEEREEWVYYSLIVGKNHINFRKNSGISGAGCGRMVTNYHLTLPGGWRLPVTIQKETVTQSELFAADTDAAALQGFAERHLGTQMIAGAVTEAMETITEEDGIWVLRGEYACTEMIARMQAVQNGELHETD